jgi:hypothetical protein
VENNCFRIDSLTHEGKIANRKRPGVGRTSAERSKEITFGVSGYRLQPRVRTVGIQAVPDLAEHSTRPALCIVLGSQSIVSMHLAEVCSDDRELPYREDSLGCARGVLWVLVLQAAAVVIVAACWSMHIFVH